MNPLPLLTAPFRLPVAFDLAAIFLFAVTGGLAGVRKRYDVVGVGVLALVTGLGGALLRDGLFLQQGPPAFLADWRYLAAVLAGGLAGAFFARHLHRLALLFVLADALALGIYGVVGAQKALAVGLSALAATLVGTVNAVGGGVLRDVIVRDEPLIFKPGEFYALASLVGCVLYVFLAAELRIGTLLSAFAGIGLAFTVRVLSIRLGWKTGALWEEDERTGP